MIAAEQARLYRGGIREYRSARRWLSLVERSLLRSTQHRRPSRASSALPRWDAGTPISPPLAVPCRAQLAALNATSQTKPSKLGSTEAGSGNTDQPAVGCLL